MTTVIRKSELSTSVLEKRHGLVHAVSWTVRSSAWSPPTDVYETDDAYVIRVEVAGMRDAEFEITFENGYLQISGTRPDVPERRAYQQMEIRFGRFSTSVGLPGTVDVEASTAQYQDGFLTVILPKKRPVYVEVKE